MRKRFNSITKGLSRFYNLPLLRSMRTKLTLSYLLLTFFPLLIITIFVLNVSLSTLKNEVSTYVSSTLEQVNSNINNTFTQLSNKSIEIGLDQTVQGILKKDAQRPVTEKLKDDQMVSQIIREAVVDFPNIESIFVFSYNGEIFRLTGVGNSIVQDYNFTRTRWFEKMKKQGAKNIIIPTHVQDEVIGEGDNRKVFTYISEIKDVETQNNIGYVLFDIDISVFDKYFKDMFSDDSGELVIIDDNKTVIYHSKPEYISTQYRENYVSDMLELGKGSLVSKSKQGEVMVTFETSRDTGWTIMRIMPTDALFARIRSVEFALIYTMLLCLVFAFVIAVLMSRTLTEPISLLKKRMKLAEAGEFDIQIPVKSKDEIGELSITFNKMILRIKSLINRIYHTEIVRKEAEISALQAQINPHFLYNTLQIMDIMAEEKGADNISSACQSLAKVFRYSISKGKDIVKLGEEIQYIKNYVFIQQLRLGSKLEMVYKIDAHLLEYDIIKLIIQPLVENAIIHGVEKSGERCIVKISADLVKDNMIISVEDNGVGMDKLELKRVQDDLYKDFTEKKEKRREGGIALNNVNTRIKLYYSDKYGMSIQSKEHVGTKITLVLPAEHETQFNREE